MMEAEGEGEGRGGGRGGRHWFKEGEEMGVTSHLRSWLGGSGSGTRTLEP